MGEAKRDGNFVPTLLAVSNSDGVTPITLYADPTTHRLLTSAVAGSLDNLTDVVITGEAQGDILYRNATQWVNLAAGTDGHFLKTQGAGANPTWAAPTATAAPGGSDTQMQFNDAGTLAGDAGFTYNKTSNVGTIGGMNVTGLTASEIVGTDASKNLVSLAVATYPSLTELTYVKGVTSAIQTQIGTKAPSTSPTFATSITGSYLTASEFLITDGSKNIVSAAVATYPSLTELTYVKGVTSAIQTQLNAKAPLASPTFTGTVTLPVGLTGVLRADTGVVSADTDVTDLVAAASATAAGKVELATDAETVTGTDTARATTPANITAKMAAPGAIGGTTPAAGAFTTLSATGAVTASTTIELGHATDTTLSRVSAGVIAVEGVTVDTISAANTLTNKTLTSPVLTTPSAFTTGGTITLAENTSIALDPAGSADGKYSGITIAGTAGTALAFGQLCYLAVADSRWELADADAAATMGTPLLGMCVLAAAGDGNATTMLLYGTIRADAQFPALTIGATVYGGETAGAIQVAIPTGADNIIRVVGHALTADEIMFNPSQDHQVTVA